MQNGEAKSRKLASKAEGEEEGNTTYSRADAGLWDDAYLIQLWNEQLELLDGKQSLTLRGAATPNSNAEDEDEEVSSDSQEDRGANSGDDEEDEERGDDQVSDGGAVGCGRAFAALANMASSTESPRHNAPVDDPPPATCPLSASHLPREVQALVQSFYAAGFEAGRYTALHRDRRKRGREER